MWDERVTVGIGVILMAASSGCGGPASRSQRPSHGCEAGVSCDAGGDVGVPSGPEAGGQGGRGSDAVAPDAAEGGHTPDAGHGDGDVVDAAERSDAADAARDPRTEGGADGALDGADAALDAGCPDEDLDGVCDAEDRCPGYDDGDDADGDGRPDGCEPTLLKDINLLTESSEPADFTVVGSGVFFTARFGSGFGRRYLWRTERLPDGSWQAPARLGGESIIDPRRLTRVGDELRFFGGEDPVADNTFVWGARADGSDLRTLARTGFAIMETAVLGDVLVYVDSHGILFRTDGTESGTYTLTPYVQHNVADAFVVKAGSLVYHIAVTDPVDFYPFLYRSDGTREGTYPVPLAGRVPDRDRQPAVAGERIFFMAYDRASGSSVGEIWESNGTAEGTRPLLVSAPPDFIPVAVQAAGGLLYIHTAASQWSPPNALWVSQLDGSGLVRLDVPGLVPATFVEAGGLTYGIGNGLWLTDGTVAGSANLGGSSLMGTPLGGVLTRGSSIAPSGTDVLLHRATGSTLLGTFGAGITDLEPLGTWPEPHFWPRYFVDRDTVFFSVRTDEQGVEPWATSGTPESTRPIADVNSATLGLDVASFSGGARRGDPVSFVTKTQASPSYPPREPPVAVHRTWGNEPSTVEVAISEGFVGPWLTVGDYVFFRETNTASPPRTEVRRVGPDGSAVLSGAPVFGEARLIGDRVLIGGLSVVPLADLLLPVPTLAGATSLASVGGELGEPVLWEGYWWVVCGSNLVRTDGTAQGTQVVASDVTSRQLNLASSGLYFPVKPAGAATELFRVPPGGRTAEQATTLAAERLSWGDLAGTAALGSHVYFTAYGEIGSTYVYRTGGAGQERLPQYVYPAWMASAGNRLVVMSVGGALWSTDGATLSMEMLLGDGCEWPRAVYRGLAYFSRRTPQHGVELWRTDGTAAGTFMEADTVPGPGSFGVERLYVSADALYIVAHTPAYGNEPWVMRH